jgi:Na+-transporting NADH:ubiquinone oxidoreductase subunit F
MTGPFGDFFLKDSDAEMICVAGGSGMSPIRSIINTLSEQNKINRKISYFFGARSTRDLFYLEEFYALEKKHELFKFIPVLSEPEENDGWTGETGLVTEALDRHLKSAKNSQDIKEGYLCGSPGMIDACVKVMLDNGIRQDKIYYDKFA